MKSLHLLHTVLHYLAIATTVLRRVRLPDWLVLYAPPCIDLYAVPLQNHPQQLQDTARDIQLKADAVV